MRRILIAAFVASVLAPAVAAAQVRPRVDAPPAPSASSDLILAIDARRTSATGTSSAGDHGNTTFQSYTYATAADLCGLGTGDDEPARMPWVGWHYTADILGSSIGAAGPELNVRITWERRWNNGARTSDGPRGTNTVTMRGGDVLVLDRVTPSSPGRCGEELRLEASVMTAASRYRGMRGTGVGGRGGAGGVMAGGGRGTATGASAGGGRGGAAASGGTGTTGVAAGGGGMTGTAAGGAGGTGSTAVSGRGGRGGGGTGAVAPVAPGSTATSGRGGGRGGASSTTGGAPAAGRGQSAWAAVAAEQQALREKIDQITLRRTAEVWLLHRKPDGVEHVQQQTIQFSRAAREFSFPPVAVNTSRGVVMVDITGSLRITDTQISIGLGRRARASGASPLDTTGSSEMTFDLPKPEDVLSFEFPALQKPAEDLLAKHKFSVRVRVR